MFLSILILTARGSQPGRDWTREGVPQARRLLIGRPVPPVKSPTKANTRWSACYAWNSANTQYKRKNTRYTKYTATKSAIWCMHASRWYRLPAENSAVTFLLATILYMTPTIDTW